MFPADHLEAIVGLNSTFLWVWSIAVFGLTVSYCRRQGLPAVCQGCAMNMMHTVNGMIVCAQACVCCVLFRRHEEEVAAALIAELWHRGNILMHTIELKVFYDVY